MLDKKSQKCSRFSIDILFRGNSKATFRVLRKKARITIGDRFRCRNHMSRHVYSILGCSREQCLRRIKTFSSSLAVAPPKKKRANLRQLLSSGYGIRWKRRAPSQVWDSIDRQTFIFQDESQDHYRRFIPGGIKFVKLPNFIRKYVSKGKIPSGIASVSIASDPVWSHWKTSYLEKQKIERGELMACNVNKSSHLLAVCSA